MTDRDITLREKIAAVASILKYRPWLVATIVLLNVGVAVLESVGISFILPIIGFVTDGGTTGAGGTVAELFTAAYDFIGVPFTLETVVVGVAAVMALRYLGNIAVAWCRETLRSDYKRHLMNTTFQKAMDARMSYFDGEGTEEILNAVVTQADYASQSINRLVRSSQLLFLTAGYLALAFYFSPLLTVFTFVVIGGITLIIRILINPGYAVGNRVAEANERIQTAAQAGTEGIRDIKIFNLQRDLHVRLADATDDYVDAAIKVNVNREIVSNVHQMSTAIFIFVLIYVAVSVASLSIGSLGVFLFAMFRMAPKISTLQNQIYQFESDLPHYTRTWKLTERLDALSERSETETSVPDTVDKIAFENVTFAYDDEGSVLKDVSFEADRGEFIAFVGQSGAGKSTIASLLVRFYDPDQGRIFANGQSIHGMDIDHWRSRVAVVRQSPYIFNDTLRFNLSVASDDASLAEIERACEIAQVTEFLDDLPQGLDSELGDDGAQLSGGQKQRIALARAILKDADVLLLDEATSDLDAHIQEDIQSAIEDLAEDRILVSISHRLSTVREADRIYTLENGGVTEVGTHSELMERRGGYHALHEQQMNN